MAQRIDGWTLMARIAASPERFGSCDTTVSLAALLLVRSQLVQGVASRAALVELARVVGHGALREVMENLASYEAQRVASNIDAAEGVAERRTPEAARRFLLEIIDSDGPAASAPAPEREPPAAAVETGAPAAATRPLRRHRAMGARRIRPET